VAQWALIVLTAYFGGRSLEKVARILGEEVRAKHAWH
jgi:uncharacterized membrane protein